MNDYELSDLELFTLIKCQNEEAFNFLFFRYEKLLRTITIPLLNEFDYLNVDKDELTQIGRISTNNAITNYEPNKGTFFNFWYNTVYRDLITYIRTYFSKKKYKSICVSDLCDQEIDNADDYFFVDDSDFTEKTNTRIIIDKINLIKSKELNERDAKILDFIAQGYSYKEIADMFNVETKTIDNRIYLIRRKIRKYF